MRREVTCVIYLCMQVVTPAPEQVPASSSDRVPASITGSAEEDAFWDNLGNDLPTAEAVGHPAAMQQV